MATRILVGVALGPAFLAALYLLPPLALAVLVAFIAGMASFELLRAAQVPHHNGMYAVTAVAAVLIPLGHGVGFGGWTARAAALLLMAALFLPALRQYGAEGEISFSSIMVCLFGGIGIPVFLSALVQLKWFDCGQFYVLLPVICAFTTDIGAYFFGVFLGRHRGITQVSPNKSLEGYIGGIVTGCLCMLLYGWLVQYFGGVTVKLPVMALYGLLGSAITELGDLSFSLIKRQHHVKDYGALLPGHGGMLDRFDSTTFAAPMLLLLVEVLPAF
ncbi:MAG: phosphatidate cytidylyltransferase [Lawsonibacter sp.]|uniref:phosphatidate cytidylyltransferase n=1 Tax=Lawsonibacter sp. JLR.KK007 TaxID=3114293 RepID=UPI00216D30A1|nr:phosphatidate cytidylyltransferase [Lawsonibacter sp.]MCI8989506.1 phosphatidate cytidylyltransferase [Lawsonibacter sp.]MCI9267744.1 phosphatidate cytidylyltransferase [Lawsonibacter sp.]